MEETKQDTFRKEYKPMSPELQALLTTVKEAAEVLEKYFNDTTTPNNGREMALAKTKLEESIMWAVKGLTK